MVISFSGNSVIKRVKLYFKIAILVIIVFYILPNLLSLLWYIPPPNLKIREEHLLEKPLRVIVDIINTS
jgi:hypothetical protein